MPGWIGPWELLILLVIVLLVFGPKRLPEMGRSLGRGMREFKNSISEKHLDDDDEPSRPALSASTQADRRCRACSATNTPDAAYCASCGSRLDATCPECGKEAGLDDRHCTACGAALPTTEPIRAI